MPRFDSFVVFAEMRTGSNFLETNLNALGGVTCHGEAFNPNFIAYPNCTEVLGVTREARDQDPHALLDAIRAAKGMNGFRYFNSHDGRVFDAIMADQRCAKIILTRNPIESYVSWKIAKSTGQWKLTDVKRLREDTVAFEAPQFEAHMQKLQAFQLRLLAGLQTSGQTAFYIDYEDLQDLEVMNGLATYLGVAARLSALDKSLKKQNPAALSDKVDNFDEMETALARMDRFNLNRTPNFEPRRGPSLPSYVAAPISPLMHLPVRSGPEDAVATWLAALDGEDEAALITGFSQKTLRDWKEAHPGHRSFAVVRHPVARAHAAFCDKILPMGKGSYVGIRKALSQQFNLNLPSKLPDASYGPAEHKLAFMAFLAWVKSNLGGQTAVRVDSRWATQIGTIQGFCEFFPPDLILREDRLEEDLAILAAQIGKDTMPALEQTDPHAEQLALIYDAEVEAAAYDTYQRDYIAFGFGPYAG